MLFVLQRRQLHCPARELILGDSVRSYSKRMYIFQFSKIVRHRGDKTGVQRHRSVRRASILLFMCPERDVVLLA